MRRLGTSTCIINGDALLVGKRGPDCKRGHKMYAVPGGGVEDNESVIASAAREVLEETGLVVSYASRPFEVASCFAITDLFPDKDKLVCWMYAFYQGGKPVNVEQSKCYGWEWRSLDWLSKNIPEAAHPGTEEHYWLPLPLLRHHLTPLMGASSGHQSQSGMSKL